MSAFHRDAPYLFLGASFVAVGIVSASFAVLRRRRDSLLIYFALFAAFYGLRLWVQSALLGMTIQGSIFYDRLRSFVNYIILIPAFLFFISLGLPRRFERVVGYAMVGLGGVLAVSTFIFGDSNFYERINSLAVIAASGFFVIRFMTSRREAADFAVIRWGLLIFVTCVVWQNIAGLLAISFPRLEPFGFAAFLITLGYVAARRTLERDHQLNEIQKELEVAAYSAIHFAE